MVGKVLDYEAKRIYNQGRKEGEEEAWIEGWIEGWKKGWEEGWREGWKMGKEQGQMETLIAMIRINRLTLQEAAKIAGVTEEVFRERAGDLL